jgi:hypothetical protein
MDGKKIRSDTERALQDHASLPHLQNLVDAGCDRDELLFALELAFLADESWETQLGMKLRDFKVAISHVRHCADTIDRLNRSKLIYRASIEYHLPGFVGLRESPTLAERLREYATMLDWLRRVSGPKRSIGLHAWKAYIVAVVTEGTKKPHDLEVSSLIAAVLDDAKYSLDAHKTWRLKQTDLIEQIREKVHYRRLKRAFLSPPWLYK